MKLKAVIIIKAVLRDKTYPRIKLEGDIS